LIWFKPHFGISHVIGWKIVPEMTSGTFKSIRHTHQDGKTLQITLPPPVLWHSLWNT